MKTQFRKPSRGDLGGRRLERDYQCASCGGRHRSAARMRSCPDCGERLAIAVIRRAVPAFA